MTRITIAPSALPTSADRWTKPVRWYRTPIDTWRMIDLQTRSNLHGAAQTFGYLGLLLTGGSLALYSAGHWPWWATIVLTFLHGTCYAFQINAVHELGHGTVFRTRSLNTFFQRIFAFLGWINYPMFSASHARHHQFTLHPPDDLEVVLPIYMTLRQFLLTGFIDPGYLKRAVGESIRIARGRFAGEWELALFPEADAAGRDAAIRWARLMLAGHGLILVGSLVAAVAGRPQLLMLPLLITLGRSYGSWLFFSCNNTQHVGMQQNVPDYRLCCRTFLLNPVVRFLYWNMNFHVEHHMYTQVPGYRLAALRQAIEHDLPSAPRGILAVWREIALAQGSRPAESTTPSAKSS